MQIISEIQAYASIGVLALFVENPIAALRKKEKIMPLVRIDLPKGKEAAYRQEIGRVVYEALVGVGVPKK